MARRKYNSISDIDRDRVIRAYEENKDWVKFAENLNTCIRRQTAQSILKTFLDTGRRSKKDRGGSTSKVDEEMRNLLIQLNC